MNSNFTSIKNSKCVINLSYFYHLDCNNTTFVSLISEQTAIIKNRLLGIIKLEKQYSLHVEFMVTELFLKDGWYNIFHATISGNVDVYGSRVPGIWIHYTNGIMNPSVHVAVNGNINFITRINPIQLKKWIIINASQTKVGNNYQYVVEMNGKVVQTVKNTKPRLFENVNIYISDPWYPAVPGYLRNVYLKGKLQLNTFDTLCVFLFPCIITKTYTTKNLQSPCDNNENKNWKEVLIQN